MKKPKKTNGSVFGEVLNSALADNTRIAYDKGWSFFQDYCAGAGIDPLDASPDQVAEFFVDVGCRAPQVNGKKLSISTLILYRCAINRQYVEARRPSPASHPSVTAVLKGLARLNGAAQRRVQALREHHILDMLEQCGSSLIGLRDAAIISLGFSAALRRSEICALTIDDIQIVPPLNGDDTRKMFVHIRKSKTDQTGKGQRIAVPEGQRIQPIKHLEGWLRSAGITYGYLFQTMKRGGGLRGRPLHHADIPRLLKRYAGMIGLDPDEISGHSLRAGFVTSAAVHHARLDKIMEITRHSNPETLMRYIRDVELFKDHAGKDFL